MHLNSQMKQVKLLALYQHDDVQPQTAHVVVSQLPVLTCWESRVPVLSQAWAHLDRQRAC